MAKKKGTEMAKANKGEYALLKSGTENLARIIQENTGGAGVSRFDLDKISIPAGGGKLWTIPTADGESEVAEFRGVVISQRWVRAYWKKGLDEGEVSPPDCTSEDCVTGHGDPGGSCLDCMFRQFGTGRGSKGRGQACKHIHLLFVMLPESMLPVVLPLPPTSHSHPNGSRKYFMRLAGFGRSYYSVETSFKLEVKPNPDGIKYSRAVLSKFRDLSEDEAAAFCAVGEALSSQFQRVKAADVTS